MQHQHRYDSRMDKNLPLHYNQVKHPPINSRDIHHKQATELHLGKYQNELHHGKHPNKLHHGIPFKNEQSNYHNRSRHENNQHFVQSFSDKRRQQFSSAPGGTPGGTSSPDDSKNLYKCSKCSQSFKNSRMLMAHHNSVHKEVELYKCSKCMSQFAEYSALIEHQKMCQQDMELLHWKQ